MTKHMLPYQQSLPEPSGWQKTYWQQPKHSWKKPKQPENSAEKKKNSMRRKKPNWYGKASSKRRNINVWNVHGKQGLPHYKRRQKTGKDGFQHWSLNVKPALQHCSKSYSNSSGCWTTGEKSRISVRYSGRPCTRHLLPAQVNVRPPNCCNKLICTDGNLLPWPSSGGVIPPRQRYAITATIIRLAKESANLYCNTCCKVYK